MNEPVEEGQTDLPSQVRGQTLEVLNRGVRKLDLFDFVSCFFFSLTDVHSLHQGSLFVLYINTSEF